VRESEIVTEAWTGGVDDPGPGHDTELSGGGRLDVARVRGLYPTLSDGTAALDGGFAALQPESVIRAIIATLRSAPAQPGSSSERSQRSGRAVVRARRAAADLLAARPDDVVLADGPASLLWRLTSLLSGDWQLGDTVVLSRLDTNLVARSWRHTARGRGVGVRYAEVDLETGELPSWQYEQLVDRHTRIVTVALGNPATGVVPDVTSIAEIAHRHGALVIADAGVAPAYYPLELDEIGADVVIVDGAVFGGPLVSAAVARPGLFEEIGAVDALELLPLPVELLDGFTAAVDHLADLDERAAGNRRERLAISVPAAGVHTGALYTRLDAELRSMPHVTVLGGPDRHLPVAAFTVAEHTPAQVGAHLASRRISVWTGPSGMTELLRAFGADEFGGASFLGVMPHTAPSEIDQLLDAVRDLKN
jgi:selenocysteine lyase/cysteine desulfurase